MYTIKNVRDMFDLFCKEFPQLSAYADWYDDSEKLVTKLSRSIIIPIRIPVIHVDEDPIKFGIKFTVSKYTDDFKMTLVDGEDNYFSYNALIFPLNDEEVRISED
jgi:hypothetical protein